MKYNSEGMLRLKPSIPAVHRIGLARSDEMLAKSEGCRYPAAEPTHKSQPDSADSQKTSDASQLS